MKKIFFVLAFVLLAASCGQNNQQNNNQPSPTPTPSVTINPTPTQRSTADWKTYASPEKYGFTIMYPNDFGFSTDINQAKALAYIPVCDQTMLACAYIKSSDYPGTNFDGAGISINVDSTLNTQAKCYDFKSPTTPVQNDDGFVKINGLDFRAGDGGDAGAGHFETIKVYLNFHNNLCYEISAHVGSTNINNYQTGTIKQFDENAIWQKLQDVANTFIFQN